MNNPNLRVLFLGMFGPFSQAALVPLLARQINLCAVVVPLDKSRMPGFSQPWQPVPAPVVPGELLLTPPPAAQNIVQLGWENEIPVFAVQDMNARKTQSLLKELRPDVACVACFDRRIPGSMLSVPRFGFLNLHPSLLPAYRGPTPLFWQFRAGETNTGVTVHWMDEGLDTGDLAAQETVPLPDGVSGSEADRLLGTVGGHLFLRVFEQLQDGIVPRTPQPAGGSYQPPPKAADFALSTDWSARRAFNFMRGAADWGEPYPVVVAGGQTLLLGEAIAFDEEAALDGPWSQHGDLVKIQFTPGVLTARLYPMATS
jgi:methionyl-tRNA formyltransferase